MDPLSELKSLLNIPEGMTAGEAGRREAAAIGRYAQIAGANYRKEYYLRLASVWGAIAIVLEADARHAPSA